MLRLRSLLALAVPALVLACSSAGTSLEDYPGGGGEGESTVDAGAATSSASGSSGSVGGSGAGSTATGTGTTSTSTTSADSGSPAPASGADAGSAADAAPAPLSCPYTGTPLATAGFASCGDGAVCAPTALIPAASQADFAACATGLCVPAKVIAAYGNYLPATCQSLESAEGRCLNVVLPSVAGQKDELPQASCDAAERCVPCFSPLDGSSTGACSTVSCDAPKEPATTFATCCNMGGSPQGRCVPASVAGASASELDSEGCSEAGDVCAPAEALSPSFVPQACKANDSPLGFITGSYTGVCLSLCIPQDFTEGLGTGQGNCDSLHFCAPCNDPFSGDPTGVPGCPAN